MLAVPAVAGVGDVGYASGEHVQREDLGHAFLEHWFQSAVRNVLW